MKIKSINLLAPILLVIAVWLGATGRVDWWVIFLIAISQFSVTIHL